MIIIKNSTGFIVGSIIKYIKLLHIQKIQKTFNNYFIFIAILKDNNLFEYLLGKT